MIGKPKFKLGELVNFKLGRKVYSGKIYIIDSYGTFEDDSDVSYDIMVNGFFKEGEDCLVKHINEKLIIEAKNIKN